jgi:hypothetical protein
MIDHLTADKNDVQVHLAKISLKTTKSFTHGSIAFDTDKHMVTFGNVDPVPIPKNLELVEGATLKFSLFAPDGKERKQKREGVLHIDKKRPELFRIGGHAQTARQFSAEDGWGNCIYKYRAYFTHPGLDTDHEVPEWLNQSVARQKEYWNRMAWLCRDARRKCSPVPTEEIKAFVSETILPAIDKMNEELGRSKEKMRHPQKLKVEMPGLDGLWNFVGELRSRIDKGRRVPEGLLDNVVKFAEQYKPDFTPMNDFMATFNTMADREAKELKLRPFEKRPVLKDFSAVLKHHSSAKMAWSEGWPTIRYPDSPDAADWSISYYFNKAGVEASLLSADKGASGGVPGLILYPPTQKSPNQHEGSVAWKRDLRLAKISIPGDEKKHWDYTFGVLQHRPLPENAHVKEWKLIYQKGKLYLCLVLEVKNPLPHKSEFAAGLDIGWRRTEEGIRFGTLFEEKTGTFRHLTVDFQRSPKDQKARVPFRMDMGPTRWDKRNVKRLQPNWKPGDPLPSVFHTRMDLQTQRDNNTNQTKLLLRQSVGEALPPWFEKAKYHGLIQLKETLKENEAALQVLEKWEKRDKEIGDLAAMYSARMVKRIEDGHSEIAHDVLNFLKDKGITHLFIEEHFLAKASQRHDNMDPESLKRSQKYRQFIAVGKFLATLKNIAAKEGFVIDKLAGTNTTRICWSCNHLNESTQEELYECKGCGRLLNQDENASINLVRFGKDTKLAEMALHAKVA